MTDNEPARTCGLYLRIAAGHGTNATERVLPLLETGNVACVLVAPPEGNHVDVAAVKALCEVTQARGIAALLLNDAQLARTVKADGVHLAWQDDAVDRYRDARDIMGGQALIGVDAGRSRHDAMSVGEAGVDYVAFGIPAHVKDVAKARMRQADLIGWWSELFEVPCVACDVGDASHMRELALQGADYVMCDIPDGQSPSTLLAWLDTCVASVTCDQLSDSPGAMSNGGAA